MKSKLLAIASVVGLIAVMVPSVAFAAGDDVGGEFTTNSNVPVVTVKLFNADGTAEVNTSMTPLTAYDVKVNVTDPDGLTNMGGVVLKLWYDTDGGDPSVPEFDAIAVGNANTAIIITWTKGGTFVLTEESGSSWELGTGVVPAALPGDFEFKFTVGKVATETSVVGSNWQIAAKVTDQDATPNVIFAFDSSTSANDMDPYREIAVSGSSVNWGTINTLPLNAGEGDPSEESVGSIIYTSNGNFTKKVSTTSTWGSATLDPDGGTLAANNFSLMADDDDTFADAAYVTTAGGTIGSGTITGELGSTDPANSLWLALASTFSGGTFSGTVTYTIN